MMSLLNDCLSEGPSAQRYGSVIWVTIFSKNKIIDIMSGVIFKEK